MMVYQSKGITRELDRNADSQDLLHPYQIRNSPPQAILVHYKV